MLYHYQRELTGSARSPIVDITGGTNRFPAMLPVTKYGTPRRSSRTMNGSSWLGSRTQEDLSHV
jgi:hypothetical protein